ncbi:MAG: aminotransferase class I/II-fold pyridoxal phosphate-dependent enzyme [Oscillospiraceae bacterium]|nr:aminotransferase class I/II-fold pyridoxal phosphate-dependent enzyme [Oscillospiraceae bacterium]
MREHLNSALFALQRSVIREFSRLARETPGCVSLTLGEPDFDTPAPIRAAAASALESHETHYIENNGALLLREKIAAFEREKHGCAYAPEEVIVTAGATEAIFVALFGVLNPGDEVIVPMPAFVLYQEIIKLCRGVCVPLDTAKTGFQIDEKDLQSLITPRTKAIVLNSPNNPTGCVLNGESLAAVHRCVEGRGIFVVCDDVYRELIYTGDYHSFAEFSDLRSQILLCQSFSKPWAMTGWRMGYLLAEASVKERLELLHQFMVVSTPAPFQRACVRALDYDPKELRDTYARRREYVLGRLSAMGLSAPAPEGAFYVFPSIRRFGLDSADFCRRMIREAGLAATPGVCFGGEGHIRLSYCYSDAELREALDRLERFLHSLEG